MKNYSINELINFFNPHYSETFSISAGVWEEYSIEDHVRIALNQFDKYFLHKPLPCKISNTFFRILIVLHNMGKPAAIKKGKQKTTTQRNFKID